MLRSRSLWSSVCVTALLSFSFNACGGSTDNLFTSGGSGAIANAGASSDGGRASSTGGSSSSSGTGAMTSAGASSGGRSNTGGQSNSGGETTSGGSSSAGSNAGGSSNGGGGAGAAAGNAGSGATSGGSAGASAGGSSAGSESGGGASSAGTGGGTTNPSCADLLALAEQQLTAAQACDNSHNAEPCTGRVMTRCSCTVAVDSQSSAETQAYLATLQQLEARHCGAVCPALACLPITRAQCSSKGGSGGVCVAMPGPITQ